MTTPTQAISYTTEGAVTISYATLVSNPLSLEPFIEQAFGSRSHSLGIVIVCDLPPSYITYRERLLKHAYKFAKLNENVREKYTDPGSRYNFGWSHGKEIMNGKPDILKGSYYANPTVDNPTAPAEARAAYPEYYGQNIWPDEKDIKGFEEAFKDLGRFVFKVGCELAVACQPFGKNFDEAFASGADLQLTALSHLSDSSVSLPELISTSQINKARLLHYFPPPPKPHYTAMSDDEPVDSWCGFHIDHSLLTGLCSAIFLQEGEGGEPTIIPSPSPASGLYIRTRGGELTKVTIPADCLAFQTGEALEIATGGKLRATPHCVRVGSSPETGKISRETFALFMQPDTNQQLSPSQTFGQFSQRVFDEHYDSKSTK